MSNAKKRGLEFLGKFGFSPGQKDRKVEMTHEQLQDIIRELGTEDFSAASTPLSSRSTSEGDGSSSGGTVTPTSKKQNGGGGKGGGKKEYWRLE